MLENAVYSVISPESCAAIIYRDSGKAELAAMALNLTAPDLIQLGIVDGVIPEPEGGAHEDHDRAAELMRETLRTALADLSKHSCKDLADQRYEKFRKMGSFFSEGPGA
jgi:acetyl-CoA carboxylase carboxyl transferase subunit alpha